jgi:hypothetical protein
MERRSFCAKPSTSQNSKQNSPPAVLIGGLAIGAGSMLAPLYMRKLPRQNFAVASCRSIKWPLSVASFWHPSSTGFARSTVPQAGAGCSCLACCLRYCFLQECSTFLKVRGGGWSRIVKPKHCGNNRTVMTKNLMQIAHAGKPDIGNGVTRDRHTSFFELVFYTPWD